MSTWIVNPAAASGRVGLGHPTGLLQATGQQQPHPTVVGMADDEVVEPVDGAVESSLFLQDPGVEPLALFLKEGTLAWSNCYHRGPGAADFDEAVRILGDEREKLEALLTHTVPLDEIDRAFRLASDKKAGVIKVAVVP